MDDRHDQRGGGERRPGRRAPTRTPWPRTRTLTVPAAGVLANDTRRGGEPAHRGARRRPGERHADPRTRTAASPTPRGRTTAAPTRSPTARPTGRRQGNVTTVSLTVTRGERRPGRGRRRVHRRRGRHPDRRVRRGRPSTSRAWPAGTTSTPGSPDIDWQQGVRAGAAGTLASFDLFIGGGTAARRSTCIVNKGAPWQSDAPEFVTRLTVTSAMVNQWVTFDASAANIALAAGEWFTIGTRNGSGSTPCLVGASDGRTATPTRPASSGYNGSARPAAAGAATTSSSAPGWWPRAASWPTTPTRTATPSPPSWCPARPTAPCRSPRTAGSPTPRPRTTAGRTASPTRRTTARPTATWRPCRITVTAVNDAPTLAAVGDLTIAEDAGAETVSLTGITAGPPTRRRR